LDYAGFRTLDTVVRAKNVFGKNKFLVITQWGHAERSVYLARKHGVEAYGFYAAEPNHIPWLVKKNRSREVLAAVAAEAGVELLAAKPKYCGDNGAMIAALAYYRRNIAGEAALAMDVNPSLEVGG
jgi:SanA protein